MNRTVDHVRMAIAVLIVAIYCYLVVMKIAAVEGFCVMATYIIKKFLDGIEESPKTDTTTDKGGEIK